MKYNFKYANNVYQGSYVGYSTCIDNKPLNKKFKRISGNINCMYLYKIQEKSMWNSAINLEGFAKITEFLHQSIDIFLFYNLFWANAMASFCQTKNQLWFDII